MPIPLSVSYNVPEEMKRKELGGKFVHLHKLLLGFTDQDEGQSNVLTPRGMVPWNLLLGLPIGTRN